MILAFFFITFYQNNTGSVRLCDEFDILPQSSSPNNNNKGGGGGGGGGQGAYISSPLKGMVVKGIGVAKRINITDVVVVKAVSVLRLRR